MRILFVATLLVAVSACVPQPAPPPAPAPAPVVALPAPPVIAAPRGGDWRDWPLTPGDWTWRREPSGSVAQFGPAGAARLTLRCDPGRRQVVLTVAGATATPLTVRTTSVTRSLALQPGGAIALPATDALLDAMAFSRGRFALSQAGAAPLVVPAWAEIGRVAEDCR